MLNESLVKYLAGLLDADGSLGFQFKEDQNREGQFFIGIRMGLASSDAVDHTGFVESLPEITGMGSTTRYGNESQFISWIVSKRSDIEMLLPRVIKHMVIKGKHWNWVINRWRELRSERNTVSLSERVILTDECKMSRIANAGPLKPKNHPTWAWLAGYIDGDGCYSYRKNGTQWHMNISAVAHQNDICVLEFLQNSFGGIIRDHGQSKGVMVWWRSLGYQNKSFALSFLPNLAKHSRLKRQKIDAIIHHHRQRLSVPGTERRFCSQDGCVSPAHGRGLCQKHYLRQYRLEKVQATV